MILQVLKKQVLNGDATASSLNTHPGRHFKSKAFSLIRDAPDVEVRRSSRLTEGCNGLCCVNIYRRILGVEGQFKEGIASLLIIYSAALQRIPFRWFPWCLLGISAAQLRHLSVQFGAEYMLLF